VQFPAYEMPTVRDRIARDPAAFLRVVQDEPSLHTDRDILVQLLDEHVRNAPLVFGPAGIGGHPDHRDLAKAVAGIALPGQEVRLYADSPYFLFHGRPSFLADRPAPEADAWVDAALASVLPIRPRPAPTVVRLDDDELEAKQRALSGYATEVSSIASDMARLGIAADDLRYEAFWTLPHAPD
jgi:LmbE family N-acetylglucosaminyl deacetylase